MVAAPTHYTASPLRAEIVEHYERARHELLLAARKHRRLGEVGPAEEAQVIADVCDRLATLTTDQRQMFTSHFSSL